jgi:tetratricopeptide (TPR) repeat protein
MDPSQRPALAARCRFLLGFVRNFVFNSERIRDRVPRKKQVEPSGFSGLLESARPVLKSPAQTKEQRMSTNRTEIGVKVLALTVLVLTYVCAPAVLAQNKDMPLTGSKEALALYMQGRDKVENIEDPGTLFEQAIQKDPNFAVAYLFVGKTNAEFRKNVEKAVSLADKVSPGEKEWILAVKDQIDGNLAGRKAHLEQLVKLHPNDKRAHTQLAAYYRSIGDDATAHQHFQDAVKIDKNYAPAYNDIGYSYINMGKFPEAEAAFKTYIQLIPKNPNPYDSYAELLMRMGKYDESIVQYKKALATDPTFYNSYRGIGNNYVYKGEYTKARESYQSMYDKAPDDGGRDLALLSMVDSYIAEGNTDKAIETNERRRQMAEKAGDIPSLIGINSIGGFILLEAGKLDDAAKQFAAADKLRADPSLPAALSINRKFGSMLDSSRLMIAKGDFDAARKQLEDMGTTVAAIKNPNFDRAYHEVYGTLELKQKNYPRAIEHLSKADQTSPVVWYYQAAAYEGSGDKKMATTLYGKVANWNQLDDPAFAVVRPRAMSRISESAATSKKDKP